MFTFYPLANYENFLTVIREPLLNVLADAYVPPKSFQVLAYSTEGLGVFLQKHDDFFTKPKPFAYVTISQHPYVDETQSANTRLMRDLVTNYLGYEHRLKGSFSPLVYSGDRWFIKPIWHRVQTQIQLSIITSSQALAYEYLRYFQAVFGQGKHVSFRDIPFYHNILLNDAIVTLPGDVLGELATVSTVKVDTASNRTIYSFLDRNWVIYKLDSSDLQPENVPYEGDSIIWRCDLNFSLIHNEIAYYLLHLKHNATVSLTSPFQDISPVQVDDIINNEIIFEGGRNITTILVLSDFTRIRLSDIIFADLVHLKDSDFPITATIKLDKSFVRLFKRPQHYQAEPIFEDTINYILTNNTVYQDAYNTFIDYNGNLLYVVRDYNNNSAYICNDCFEIQSFNILTNEYEIVIRFDKPGLLAFGKEVPN